MSPLPSVILVHGAWADGSCWNNVIVALARRGFKVRAPQIPLTSLTDDIATLKHYLDRIEGPVILVSHAYSGAVISGINDPRVKGLVFVCSLTPDEGETVADVFYRTPPHPKAPHMAPDAQQLIWMPEESFPVAFAPHASGDQLALMVATQKPIAVRCIQEKMNAPAWKKIPCWFLIAKGDHMIDPATQEFMAGRMRAAISRQEVDHMPLITAPDSVVELIAKAATELSA